MAELVAVVDLGSTAVRLLLARIPPGAGYRVLVEERVPTRLGGGTPGTLPAEAIADTLRAVHRFFARYAAAQIRDILETQLADTVKARRILADGRSVRIQTAGAAPLRSQERLYETAARGTS